MSVFAPYNFVPLSRFIYLPHWADQVSHDVPFSDGVSGTLAVELTCHTPTLVGGAKIETPEGQANKVKFFKDPNGNPIIPGSSLKGMISNVLEIASFARFNRLDNKRYSVRDLNASFYLDNFKNGQVKTGWLKYNHDNQKWEITPCQRVRIKQNQIIDYCNLSEDEWVEKNEAHERYKLLKEIPPITFTEATRTIPLREGKKISMQIAIPSSDGKGQPGYIVTTGQPGDPFNSGKMDNSDKNKKWEFVFHSPDKNAIDVDISVMNNFLFIHSESKDWTFWQDNPSYHKKIGIPVFFLMADEKISSIGLSSLYRLPFRHSTYEMVHHTQKSHLAEGSPDLPALIFGSIQEDNNTKSSIKGRVNICEATTYEKHVYDSKDRTTILSSPKASFYPAYVQQSDNENIYNTFMEEESELSGWKRYPVQHKENVIAPENTGTDEENIRVQVNLEPVKANTKFQFKIHFHNLKEVELGAILWCLNFGEFKNQFKKSEMFHSLGMGKPYGLGRVSLALKEKDCTLITNQESSLTPYDLIQKCRNSFTKLMTDAYSCITQDHTWIESSQLKELFAMASLPSGNKRLSYMSTPKEFTDSKKQQKILKLYTNQNPKTLNIDKDEALAAKKVALLKSKDFELIKEQIIAEDVRGQILEVATIQTKLACELEKITDKFLSENSEVTAKKVNNVMNEMIKVHAETPFTDNDKSICKAPIEKLIKSGKFNEKGNDPKFLKRLVNKLGLK